MLRKLSIRPILRRARGHKRDRGREEMGPVALIGGVEPHDHLSVSELSASKSLGLTPSRGRHLGPWPLRRRLGTNGIDGQ
jgi:hypothetical protein